MYITNNIISKFKKILKNTTLVSFFKKVQCMDEQSVTKYSTTGTFNFREFATVKGCGWTRDYSNKPALIN